MCKSQYGSSFVIGQEKAAGLKLLFWPIFNYTHCGEIYAKTAPVNLAYKTI